MKDETKLWLRYAKENLAVARISLESHLYNPCLQNAQQAVEKVLKALIIESALHFKKTHQIHELKSIRDSKDIDVNLAPEECEFLDAIYLPSKYPLTNVYPDSEANASLCHQAIEIAEKVIHAVNFHLG